VRAIGIYFYSPYLEVSDIRFEAPTDLPEVSAKLELWHNPGFYAN